MINNIENTKVTLSKKQLKLFGYDDYFKFLVNLYEQNKLPNNILLSGPKGLGKSTFAYHFINYMLSKDEIEKYNLESKTFNEQSLIYNSLINQTNPNFFLLENEEFEENIKIEKVRNMLKFTSKSTYASNIKIILIDNAEYLNQNSSNALLKSLEESNSRTFFFIIHNSFKKILDTIKSRCIEFKIIFTLTEKKTIFKNILNNYEGEVDLNIIDDFLRVESPGNILHYLTLLKENDINSINDKLEFIFYMIENCKDKNDHKFLNFISLMIEFFYLDLSIQNSNNLNIYSANKFKLLSEINNTKLFNLDKKNLFTSLKSTLTNEIK